MAFECIAFRKQTFRVHKVVGLENATMNSKCAPHSSLEPFSQNEIAVVTGSGRDSMTIIDTVSSSSFLYNVFERQTFSLPLDSAKSNRCGPQVTSCQVK